jgi:hypothetical protein
MSRNGLYIASFYIIEISWNDVNLSAGKIWRNDQQSKTSPKRRAWALPPWTAL